MDNKVMCNDTADKHYKVKTVIKEEDNLSALGITMMQPENLGLVQNPSDEDQGNYVIIPDPRADKANLCELRGTKAPNKGREQMLKMKDEAENDELEALAELVPELKSKASKERENHTMTVDLTDEVGAEVVKVTTHEVDNGAIEVTENEARNRQLELPPEQTKTEIILKSRPVKNAYSYMNVDDSEEEDASNPPEVQPNEVADDAKAESSPKDDGPGDQEQNLGGFKGYDDTNSEHALNSDQGVEGGKGEVKTANDLYPNISSAASLSTATQTHEVRMPMYLPTFKPATGCTNASDFIVRCFVARLRSGITVVKHGRSRWCKSRLRILHIHPDGRSLSWKTAVGEPTSSKRPPKLDLSTCEEVRHAWSADPLNPVFTGTTILRQKCEAANAHKSFALIFPKRTVDITAVTADQCKVLMEGFSALCFRLQVANLAGRGAKKGTRSPEDYAETETTRSTNTNSNFASQHSPAIPNSRFKRNS